MSASVTDYLVVGAGAAGMAFAEEPSADRGRGPPWTGAAHRDRPDRPRARVDPTDLGQVHVDCSATGLRMAPGRPVFEDDRITLQQVRACQPSFNAALLAYVEASRGDDAEKNRLCPPNPYPNAAVDWIAGTYIAQKAQLRWYGESDLMDWMERCRLNAARGASAHMADPRMQSAVQRLMSNTEPAIKNLKELQAAT